MALKLRCRRAQKSLNRSIITDIYQEVGSLHSKPRKLTNWNENVVVTAWTQRWPHSTAGRGWRTCEWKLVFIWILVVSRKAPGERRPPPSSSSPTCCDFHSTRPCTCSCGGAGVPASSLPLMELVQFKNNCTGLPVTLAHGFDLWKIPGQGLSEMRKINKFNHLFLVPLPTCQFN